MINSTNRNDRQVGGRNGGQQRRGAPRLGNHRRRGAPRMATQYIGEALRMRRGGVSRMRRGEACRMVWTRNHEIPMNLIKPYFISLLSHNFPLYPLSPSEVHQLERDVITVLRNAEITAELRTRMDAAQQQGWLTSHIKLNYGISLILNKIVYFINS